MTPETSCCFLFANLTRSLAAPVSTLRSALQWVDEISEFARANLAQLFDELRKLDSSAQGTLTPQHLMKGALEEQPRVHRCTT